MFADLLDDGPEGEDATVPGVLSEAVDLARDARAGAEVVVPHCVLGVQEEALAAQHVGHAKAVVLREKKANFDLDKGQSILKPMKLLLLHRTYVTSTRLS